VIDTPPDHALADLYKDPQFLKEYREGLAEERQKYSIEQQQEDDSLQYPPEIHGRTYPGKIVSRTVSQHSPLDDVEQPQEEVTHAD
jgi:hypothetical protein